jgi:hypothetical protein
VTPVIDGYAFTVLGPSAGGTPGSEVDSRFTGKEIDETGWNYFGARYYDRK